MQFLFCRDWPLTSRLLYRASLWLVAAALPASVWAQSAEPGGRESMAPTSANPPVSNTPDPQAYDDRRVQKFYESVFRRLNRMKPTRGGDALSEPGPPAAKPPVTGSPAGSYGDRDGRDTATAEAADNTQPAPGYVIGTAAVHPQTGNADVCFRVVTGVDETARVITDTHRDTMARGEASHWHVFYRLPGDVDAQPVLVLLQRKYDEQVAYRTRLMQQYKARSIRRC